MFTFEWVLGALMIFLAVILGLAGGAALIAAAIYRKIQRRRRTTAADADVQSGATVSGVQSAKTARELRFIQAEESNRDALGWSNAADNAAATASQKQSAGEHSGLLGRGKTILLADDDPVIVFALSRRLQQLGFQVIHSPDAAHALMGAMKTKPDLIILDVNMPSGNGLAVCEMMASDPQYAGIPVIIHSVVNDEATQQRCRKLGAFYVEKSSNSWTQIKSLVETLIHKSGDEDPMETMPQSADVLTGKPSSAEPGDEPAQSRAISAGQPEGDVSVNPPTPENPVSALPIKTPDEIPQRIEPTCGHGRILCIDGPNGELALLQNRLSSLGVEVTRISDLDEGFWSCFTDKPHAVIIQTVSSGKNLKDILHRFVEHPLTRNFPLIFINQDNALSAEDLPVADNFKVLQCPIVWRDLLRELEKIIPVVDHQDADPLARTEPPVGQAEHDDGKVDETHPQPSQVESEGKALLKILCIDDDPVIEKSIAVRLNRYGIEVKGARNGTAGYLQAVSDRPDLILLDMQMPSGDGQYVLSKLKEHTRTKDIPVVILTIETHPGIRRKMLGLGAAGFLSKPARWGELFEELGRHIPLPEQLILDYKLHEEQLVSI